MEYLQRLALEKLVGGSVRRYLNAQSPVLHQDTDSQPGDARGQSGREAEAALPFSHAGKPRDQGDPGPR